MVSIIMRKKCNGHTGRVGRRFLMNQCRGRAHVSRKFFRKYLSIGSDNVRIGIEKTGSFMFS